MKEKYIKMFFFVSISFFLIISVFGYGFVAGKYDVWPHNLLVDIKRAGESFIKFGRFIPENLLIPPNHDAPRQSFTIYHSDLVNDGYYIFVIWDDNLKKYVARLYDKNWNDKHTWLINYSDIEPGKFHSPHGFKVLHDGSILVNFDVGNSMESINYCSKPIWIANGVYHHSIEFDEDGNFWSWRGDGSDRAQYQYLVKIETRTGKVIKEIGLIEDIISNLGQKSIIFGVRPDYKFKRFDDADPNKRKYDIFHPNDIDVLHYKIINKFPNFDTGDLLLSFRNIHLVAVYDPNKMKLKWWSNGPWRFQHDPDFTEDGKISVYDNNSDLGRSEIIKMDPETREVTNDLYVLNDLSFYSETMGKHQYLPNGNILIIIPDEGRIVEVTKNGEKVFEFNNIISGIEGYNGQVVNGEWVPLNYFDKIPDCLDNH